LDDYKLKRVSMTTYHQPILKRDAQANLIQESYISDMAFQGQYTGTNLIYRGYGRPGSDAADSVWQICKLTYDGSNNITSITWPEATNGSASSEFIFVWNDRATYTYV
jgi:hypothetical protein